jgi:hypothetical protein
MKQVQWCKRIIITASTIPSKKITASTEGFIQNIVALKSFDEFPDYNLLCRKIVVQQVRPVIL